MSMLADQPQETGTAPVTAARAENAVKIFGSGTTEVKALDDVSVAFEAGHYATAAVPLPSEVEAAVDWLFAQKEREDELSALLPD